MRLAFLSPLPPAPTGIADYAADVLAALADGHQLDVFHAQESVDTGRLPASCRVERAERFVARHRERPYDMAVYQMGNGLEHAFLYPLLSRVPGLLVLHELVLHHSRARMLLDTPEARAYAREPWSAARRAAAAGAVQAYAAEVACTYPSQADRLVQVQLSTSGYLLPYAYPLFRLPVEASRLTAVHNRFMAVTVTDEVPGAEVAQVAMPMAPPPADESAASAVRERHGLEADELVVGVFGLLTREKRVQTVARAVARAAVHLSRLRLMLVGPASDQHELARVLERAAVLDRTVVTGRVGLDELPAYAQAADLVAHLRYPTARETSAALLRVLAQGRPAVVSDLENLAEVPPDAVVRADPTDEEGALTRAILRLGQSAAARARLGCRAREFVLAAHSPEQCRRTYEAALARAAARPDPGPADRPGHWPPPDAGR